VVPGHCRGFDEDRLGKKVTLKERAAFRESGAELFLGFDFFGDEARLRTGGQSINFAASEKVGRGEIDFDEVGQRQKRGAGRTRKEAVEGESIAFGFERKTTVHDFGIGVDVLKNFQHRGFR
jgi:hypothetical protein